MFQALKLCSLIFLDIRVSPFLCFKPDSDRGTLSGFLFSVISANASYLRWKSCAISADVVLWGLLKMRTGTSRAVLEAREKGSSSSSQRESWFFPADLQVRLNLVYEQQYLRGDFPHRNSSTDFLPRNHLVVSKYKILFWELGAVGKMYVFAFRYYPTVIKSKFSWIVVVSESCKTLYLSHEWCVIYAASQ